MPVRQRRGAAVRPLEKIIVQVERNQRQRLFLTLFPEPFLFRQGFVDFGVDPVARKGSFRADEQDLVPEVDAPVDLVSDVVAREDLVFI